MTSFEETKKLLDNSSFYYIITTNMEGQYTYVNAHYRKAFEHIHGPVEGRPYQLTMHPDDTGVCEEVAAKCFANPDMMYPATIRKHDGKGGYVITQWEYKAMLDAHGQPAGMFCLGYDVTAYTTQQEQLTKTSKVLDEIMWQQSHVLRKPIANILGLVMVLEHMELDQNLSNICQMLIKSTTELDEAIKAAAEKARYAEC